MSWQSYSLKRWGAFGRQSGVGHGQQQYRQVLKKALNERVAWLSLRARLCVTLGLELTQAGIAKRNVPTRQSRRTRVSILYFAASAQLECAISDPVRREYCQRRDSRRCVDLNT